MNDLELATLLSMKGYSVHLSKGVNLDSIINEGMDYRPIDYEAFGNAAEKEGYIYTKYGWIEKDGPFAKIHSITE